MYYNIYYTYIGIHAWHKINSVVFHRHGSRSLTRNSQQNNPSVERRRNTKRQNAILICIGWWIGINQNMLNIKFIHNNFSIVSGYFNTFFKKINYTPYENVLYPRKPEMCKWISHSSKECKNESQLPIFSFSCFDLKPIIYLFFISFPSRPIRTFKRYKM